MQNTAELLGLSGPSAVSDMFDSLATDIVEELQRQGRYDLDATVIKGAARELAALTNGGTPVYSDELLLDALATLATERLGLTGTTRQPHELPSYEDASRRTWERSEADRIALTHGGRGDVISLAGARAGDAYDDAVSEEFDCCTDDADAQVQAILKRYPLIFVGKNARPGPQGSPGSTSDGWDRPSDKGQPGKGGVIHPEVERLLNMARQMGGRQMEVTGNGSRRALGSRY